MFESLEKIQKKLLLIRNYFAAKAHPKKILSFYGALFLFVVAFAPKKKINKPVFTTSADSSYALKSAHQDSTSHKCRVCRQRNFINS